MTQVERNARREQRRLERAREQNYQRFLMQQKYRANPLAFAINRINQETRFKAS